MQTTENVNNNNAGNLYRNYVLVMLTLVYVFNFIDRQLLVILQESIKKELQLSDTQLGVLSGLTFAIFYVTLGIPIARYADKSNRRNIVAASLGLWSMMTAFSGLARNYVQLLLARIGVGVGEAGGSPPAHAMISDYFPPQKRSTALSVYSTGIYFGILVGFLMGGYLKQQFGWRTAFFVLGIPGVIFSLLFYLTVKEPRKGATDTGITLAGGNAPSFGGVLKLLASTKTFVYLALASGLHAFAIYGLFNWSSSFLQRLHGMTGAQTGLSLGLIFGIGGGIGTFAGGWLTDYFGKKDRRWYLKVPAYAIIASIFFAVGALFLQNVTLSLICIAFCGSLHSVYLGPSISVAHGLVPAPMRALTSAILFLVINFIGLGLGPLTVGAISDLLKPTLGADGLRWAMAVIIPVSIASTTLFFVAAKKMGGGGFEVEELGAGRN